MGRRGRPPHPDVLTPREWEVLALLREGLSNEEIAQRLGISLAGAKYHVSEILGKLGVASREEAARWTPERRPWWATAALAPIAGLARRAGSSWLATGAAAGVYVLVAAGLGLLIWGLLRTSGDDDALGGLADGPPATAADVRECLWASVAENRQDADGIDAGSPSTAVTVAGEAIEPGMSQALLSLLREAEPAVFGVRATTAKISEPGRTSGVEIRVYFGSASIALRYVRPGNVAPFGLLFDPATVDNWEYVSIIIPAGYAQQVCEVPPELQQLMAGLGYEGNEPEGILETRLVPLDEAQRQTSIDRLVVLRANDPPRQLAAPDSMELGSFDDANTPREPYLGEPLTIEVWYSGVDPFPEAVRPAAYRYYPTDGAGSERGVLVLLEPGAVANGSLGNANTPPTFASAQLDELLREAGLTTGGP